MVDQTRPYSHSEPLAKAIELLLIKLPGPETTAKRPPTPLPDRVRRLLASDVDEIRDGYRAGATVTRLAQQFDIDRETVRRILNPDPPALISAGGSVICGGVPLGGGRGCLAGLSGSSTGVLVAPAGLGWSGSGGSGRAGRDGVHGFPA